MTSTTTPGHRPADPATSWWLATGTLVIGLFLGALIVGLLSAGSTTPAAGPGPAALAPPVQTPPTGTAPAGSTDLNNFTVNDACLRAVNAAQDAYTALTDIGEAGEQFNAARLDEIVRRLQPLQTSLQANLTACRVTTAPPGSASPTELPGIPTSPITAPPAESGAPTS